MKYAWLILNKESVLPLLATSLILTQIRSSFTWNNSPIVSSICVVFFFFVSFYNLKRIVFPNKIFLFVLLLSSVSFLCLNFSGSSLITLLCFCAVTQFSDKQKDRTLYYLRNILSFIVLISLFCWILHFNNIATFPLYRKLDLSIIGNPGFLDDYLFFVHNPVTIFPRFYSVFEEPGALGTLIAFVLFSSNYNIKKKSIVILMIGEVFTFSLAGYLMSIIGFLLLKSRNLKLFVLTFSTLSLFVILVYLLLADLDTFQSFIFEKLFDLKDNGVDGRTSDDLNVFFNSYVCSLDFILGMGNGYSGIHFTGAGYKLFLIDYGMVGMINLVLIYAAIAIKYRWAYWLTFIIYLMSFISQGGLFISWQIVLFSISCHAIATTRTKA